MSNVKILAEDQAVQNDADKTVYAHVKAIGSAGTESYSGYNYEEYLHQLHGRRRAKVFDEMRRSDAQIMMCISAIDNPIKDAVWEIEPGDETPAGLQVAALMKHIIFSDMDQTFPSFIGESLTYPVFGHSVFEIVHKVVFGHPKFGNYNGIRCLGWRSPKTLERWNLDEETGKLASITQYAFGDLDRQVDIPSEFLLVLTMKKEGANYEGISMLRPCYGNWLRKNTYLKLNAIGVEKFAVPTPIAKITGLLSDDARNALKTALEVYTQHEANYLIVTDSIEIDLKTNTYDPQKVETSIDNEDKRIAKAFLANFLELGTGGNGGGSFALSNDFSDFFLAGINHIAVDIAEAINMTLIPMLCKMNFAGDVPLPKMKVSGISDKAGKELSDILVALGGGKWLTPSDRDEDHLRKRLALPARSLVGTRDVQPAASGFQPSTGTTLGERIRRAGRVRG